MLYNGKGEQIPQNSGGIADNFFDITPINHTNLCNPNEILQNNQLGVENKTNWHTSEWCDCAEGQYVYAEMATPTAENPPPRAYTVVVNCNRLQFANENGVQVSTLSGVTTPQQVPSGATKVRASWYGTALDFSLLFIGVADDNTADTLPFEPYYPDTETVKTAYLKQENESFRDVPPYRNKKWCLFGDSLTDSYGGHSWDMSTSPNGGDGWKETEEKVPWTGYFFASRVARELGLTIDNRGKSGSNINTASNGNYTNVNGCAMLDELIAEVEAGTTEAPDYITVAFGSNGYSAQLGTVEDTSEKKETTAGAVKYFIEQTRTKFPNAVLGFVLPPKSSWKAEDGAPYPNTSKDIDGTRAIIKSVLELPEYGGIPYIDMSTQSGITLDMLPDKIHISSEQAQNLYYHAMRRFMMRL